MKPHRNILGTLIIWQVPNMYTVVRDEKLLVFLESIRVRCHCLFECRDDLRKSLAYYSSIKYHMITVLQSKTNWGTEAGKALKPDVRYIIRVQIRYEKFKIVVIRIAIGLEIVMENTKKQIASMMSLIQLNKSSLEILVFTSRYNSETLSTNGHFSPFIHFEFHYNFIVFM